MVPFASVQINSVGEEAYTVIKATHVMISTEGEGNRKRQSILPKMNFLFIHVEIHR